MAQITVVKINEHQYQVAITASTSTSTSTTHMVTAPPEYAQKLTGGRVNTETLVKKSFEFLLEREPNTSILRSFELSVIGRYFSEYEREITRYF